jgi:hypothetical protein
VVEHCSSASMSSVTCQSVHDKLGIEREIVGIPSVIMMLNQHMLLSRVYNKRVLIRWGILRVGEVGNEREIVEAGSRGRGNECG